MIGVVVAVMAIVCVLSVLNGFSRMTESLLAPLDPELQIQPVVGKVFKTDSIFLQDILTIKGVVGISESLQENALLKFSDRQKIVFFKGVSDNFQNLTHIDSVLIDGYFDLGFEDVPQAVLGATVAYDLGVRPGMISPLEIYVPKRGGNVNMINPAASYNQAQAFVSGVISVNMEEYDTQMIIIPIAVARKLLNYTTEVSALEIKIDDSVDVQTVKKEIQAVIGDQYIVKDKYEIHKDIYRIFIIEKWITFLILFLIVSIAIFNIVGTLTMIIIEKKHDIKTLKHLGASNQMIYRIFLYEGIGLVLIGEILGIFLGMFFCLLQEKFGIIKIASESGLLMYNSYPVVVQFMDLLIVFVAIAIVGLLAVLYPLRNLNTKLNSDYLRNW